MNGLRQTAHRALMGLCCCLVASSAPMAMGGGCPPADHDCCTTGGVGCTETACCDLVCAADPFCCQTAWDGICVGEAVSICGLDCASCPKSDHGCFSTGGPGCTDVECCEAVCAVDLFCCQTAWDGICVNQAFALCTPPLCCNLRCPADLNYDGQVDGGDLGILLADWSATGTCSNVDGQGAVDGGDLGILLAAWGPCGPSNFVMEDEPCGEDLNGGCNVPIIGDSNCCVANGGLGCDDAGCTAAVCDIDPFCCDTTWDGTCAAEALTLCPTICQQGIPQFGSVECGDKIVGNAWAEGDLRDTDWFQFTLGQPTTIVVTLQSQLPMVAGIIDTGGTPDCALATAINPFIVTGFCGSAEFEFCLAPGTWWLFAAPNTFDGFPCDGGNNVYWLELACGDACKPLACGNAGHGCFTEGGPFCDDVKCCEKVCAVDPFCCDVTWDAICVSEAAAICDPPECPSGPSAFHGCWTQGGAGCDDEECCKAVCANFPQCCDSGWNDICIDAACTYCGPIPSIRALICPSGGTEENEPCGKATNNGCDTLAASGSNCCRGNGGLGCDDPTCQDTVCAVDPFCCDTAWDGICASEAMELCGELCATKYLFGAIEPDVPICGTVWAEGGVRDTDWYAFTLAEPTVVTVTLEAAYQMTVAILVPGKSEPCADVTIAVSKPTTRCGGLITTDKKCLAAGLYWVFATPQVFDGLPCGQNANSYIVTLQTGGSCVPGECGDSDHDCFTQGGPFCDDEACCLLICGLDPFCCETAWDGICVQEALDFCAADPILNDECVDRLPIGLGSTSYTTFGATTSGPDLPAACEKGFGLALVNDIWYNYVAGSNGVLTIDLCASSYDTRVAAYNGSCGDLNLEGCNDDFCGFQSTLSIPVTGGTTYIIRIGGFSGSGTGTAVLSQ